MSLYGPVPSEQDFGGVPMPSWLVKKMQNGRIYAYIKEVKFFLERMDSVDRAYILALATLGRTSELFSAKPPLLEMLDRPLDYSRDELLEAFYDVEELLFTNTRQLEQTKKMMQITGEKLPQFAQLHAEMFGIGIKVWISTLGAGIVPQRRDDVTRIWSLLANSKESLGEAIQRLHDLEQRTASETGISEEIFSDVDFNELIQACDYVPASLKRN